MSNIDKPTLYTCFSCLHDSEDPLVCTNCGATIGQFDPDATSFSPPKHGKYFAHLAIAPKEKVRFALEQVRKIYFQSFDAQEASEGVVVRSNIIAYKKFIELLRDAVGVNSEELMKNIPFEED